MASLALGVVGGAIGFVAGGPAGAYLGFSIGVTVGGVVSTMLTKLPSQEFGKISDVRISGSGYGTMIPKVWGRVRVGGNIIWAKRLRVVKKEEDVGGKGGPKQEVTTYSYYATFACAVCEGEITRIVRIWADDKIIYNHNKTPKTKYDLTIYKGTLDQEPNSLIVAQKGSGQVPGHRGLCYVVFDNLPIGKYGNRIPSLQFEVERYINGDGETTRTGDIYREVFLSAGLTEDQFDVSEADEIVEGFAVGSRGGVREIVEDLMRIYPADLIERDGKLVVVNRGGDPDFTLTTEDLGAQVDLSDEGQSQLTVKRVQDLELPQVVNLNYYQRQKKGEQSTQTAVRYSKGALQNALGINTGLTMYNDTARQKAEMILYQMWAERETFASVLGPKWLQMAPADIVMIPTETGEVRTRLIQMDIGPFGGPIEVLFVKDVPEVYDQTITGDGDNDDEDELDNPSTTFFKVFTSNALIDDHADRPGFYVVASGEEGWEGVSIYTKRSGNAYRKKTELNFPVTRGLTTDTFDTYDVPAGVGRFWDDETVIEVALTHGQDTPPESTSDDDVYAGANVAWFDGEIIQYGTVTQIGEDTYQLSHLLRGRRGTFFDDTGQPLYHTGTNLEVIFLSSEAVLHIGYDSEMVGKEVVVKAITDEESLADVDPYPITIDGKELKPYSPAHLRGVRDGSDNLTITWIRQDRKAYGLVDGGDISMSEWREKYRIRVYGVVSFDLKRTVTVTDTTEWVYTSAMQVEDFGSVQSEVYIRVCQLGDEGRIEGYFIERKL